MGTLLGVHPIVPWVFTKEKPVAFHVDSMDFNGTRTHQQKLLGVTWWRLEAGEVVGFHHWFWRLKWFTSIFLTRKKCWELVNCFFKNQWGPLIGFWLPGCWDEKDWSILELKWTVIVDWKNLHHDPRRKNIRLCFFWIRKDVSSCHCARHFWANWDVILICVWKTSGLSGAPRQFSYNLLYVIVKMWDFIIHVKDTMTFGKLPGFLHDGLGSLAVCSRWGIWNKNSLRAAFGKAGSIESDQNVLTKQTSENKYDIQFSVNQKRPNSDQMVQC